MKPIPETLSLTRLMLVGAVELYESEGQRIADLLSKQNDRQLFNAFNAIGTALYWTKDQIETFMIPMAVKVKD